MVKTYCLQHFTIYPPDYLTNYPSTQYKQITDGIKRSHSPIYKNIKIGDNVFIGAQSIIMPGSEIGNNCIIGCGSVVRGKIESGKVVAGNPAIVIGDIHSYTKKWIINYIKTENSNEN